MKTKILHWLGLLDICPLKDCENNVKGECTVVKEFAADSCYPGELFCTSYKCRIIHQDKWGEVNQQGVISLNLERVL